MHNKTNTKTKRPLYILMFLLVLLGGLTFTMAQQGYFSGDVRFDFGDRTGPTEIADPLQAAQTYSENAVEAEADALAASEAAESAAMSSDDDALAAAQEDAESAASRAENASNNTSTAVTRAETAYDSAVDAYDEFITARTAVEEQLDSMRSAYDEASAWEDAFDAMDAFETCKDENGSMYTFYCSSEESTFNSEYWNACTDYYGSSYAAKCGISYMMSSYTSEWDGVFDGAYDDYHDYLDALDQYNADYPIGELVTLDSAVDDALADWEAAQEFETAAAASASAAREYADLAAEYTILICTDLSFDPSSYEMAADDTEASFDFSLNVETGEQGSPIDTSDWVIMPVNLMNFVLSEITSGPELPTPDLSAPDLSGLVNQTEYWNGTLVIEADGYGEFTYDGDTDDRFEIDLSDDASLDFSFAGGQAGDELNAYIDGETLRCSTTLTITQAAAEEEPGLGELGGGDRELDTPDTTVDTDGDGLTDVLETDTYDTDPTDSDSDDDGITDSSEISYGTDPNDDDSDSDGLSDYTEIFTSLTDPNDFDTDNDNYSDGAENTAGTDSLDSTEYPGSSTSTTTGDDDDDDDDDDNNGEVPTLTRDIILSTDYTCTDSFTDTKNQWFEDMVCRSKEAGWVKGYSSYVFGPSGNITRAEYIKVLTKVFGMDEEDGYEGKSGFYDVASTDWYYPYINLAEDADVIRTRDNGYYFNPNEPITRADAVLYAIRMADKSTYDYDIERVFFDVEHDDYFAYALAIAYETEVDTAEEDNVSIIEGYSDGSFRPYNYIARSEAVAIATRVAIAWGVASEDWED